jgi:hypothetical protein
VRRPRVPVALVAVVAAALGGIVVAAPASAVAGLTAQVGAIPTKVVWTRHSSRITYGGTAILEGRVESESGELRAVPVYLSARRSTSDSWQTIASTMTGATDGLFRFNRKPPQNYYFAVVYRGDAVYDSSAAYAKVEVRRKLTPSSFAPASGGKFAFYGPAKPAAKSTYKTIKLWVKGCSSCGWRTIGSTKTNSEANWRFTISGPTQSGRTYYYKAHSVASSSFTIGYSNSLQITAP